MFSGLTALGILSILYYFTLLFYTKRWNSTFARFWLVFGAFNLAAGWILEKLPIGISYVCMGIMALAWLFFGAVEILILCSMVSVIPKKLPYIIILGAQVRGVKVTDSLKRRLDRGLRYLNENPDTVVIVSGGQGRGEDISEAKAMSDYLKACGIREERIRMENASVSTYENLVNSLAFIKNAEKEKVGIVTNNFHIYRSMKLAKAAGYKKVFAIPAGSNLVTFLNYMVREFFAVAVMWLRMGKKQRKERGKED